MKHLLLIASSYFDKKNIASNRTSGIIKYLPEFGWKITLITFHPLYNVYINNRYISIANKNLAISYKEIYDADANQTSHLNIKSHNSNRKNYSNNSISIFGLLRRIYLHAKKSVYFNSRIIYSVTDLIGLFFSIISIDNRWARVAYALGKKCYTQEKYDVVLSTYNLAGSHIAASKLAKKYNIPWVADYRDLWSQNHYCRYSTWNKNIIIKKEVKTIGPAVHLTTVSSTLADDLFYLHKKPVSVISNGYDPETVNPGIPLRPKFTITYLGSLYAGKRDPKPLLMAINDLILEKKIEKEKLSIDFYGPVDQNLANNIVHYGLEECIIQHGMVSKEDAIYLQRSSQILLLLTWNHPKEIGGCPGKLYEYLAAKRPILSIGYNGQCLISELLSETKAGIHIITQNELKEQIFDWYKQYIEDGYVSYIGIAEKVDCYSHIGMAKKFAEVLNRVSNPNND